MKFRDILKTARANMRRNKARTILTIVAIFIGSLTFTLTNGIGDGIKSYLNRQVGNLGAENSLLVTLETKEKDKEPTDDSPMLYDETRKQSGRQETPDPAGASTLMNDSDLQKIKAISDVTEIRPFRLLIADYIATKGSQKYQAMVSELYGDINIDMAVGRRPIQTGSKKEVTIPKNYAKALGFSDPAEAIGKTVYLQVQNLAGSKKIVTATIVGVQEKSLVTGSNIFVSPAAADEMYAHQVEGLPDAVVKQYSSFFVFHDKELSSEKVAALRQKLTDLGYKSQTIQEGTKIVFTVINGIIIVFNSFGAIALIAASFGIMNTLLMSVQERTKEIGLMKALGMSKRKIFMLFSTEAILLGFWGSALGIVVAQIIGRIANVVSANTFLKDLEGLQLLSFPIRSVLTILLSIMFIAFIAGTIPARRAAKKDPIEALRYE